jgi:hypothetical protein
MDAVLDVLYEDGPPPAPAVGSDATAAGHTLPWRDEPFEAVTRDPSLSPSTSPAETDPIDLRPSRPAASTRGRHSRPSASNGNDEH